MVEAPLQIPPFQLLNTMNKNTLIISGSILFAIIFLIIVFQLTNKPIQTFFPEINKIVKQDHIKWSPAKKNILVEYSDFQCPACKTFHEYIKKELDLDKKITSNVTFVYRHFPLYQIHEGAFESAYAAEAAGLQGKFFEMIDLLFTKQSDWVGSKNLKEAFVKLAKPLNLNLEKFKTDMDSQAIKDKVTADQSLAEKSGVDATPTFFLNGKKLEFTSFEEFKKLLLLPQNGIK